jgi:hypothetical protein
LVAQQTFTTSYPAVLLVTHPKGTETGSPGSALSPSGPLRANGLSQTGYGKINQAIHSSAEQTPTYAAHNSRISFKLMDQYL